MIMHVKHWCPTCGGAGHEPHCVCRGDVAFIVGCCKLCSGDGMISDVKMKQHEASKHKGLLDKHGNPITSEDT